MQERRRTSKRRLPGRQRSSKYIITDSTGLPLTRAPIATAHQKVHVDGSMGNCFPPPKAPLVSLKAPPPLVSVSNRSPRSQEPCGDPESGRTEGRAITFTIASRMWLTEQKEAQTGVQGEILGWEARKQAHFKSTAQALSTKTPPPTQ